MTASYVTKRLHQISLWAIISQSTILTQEELKMHLLALFCLSQALLATLCPKSQRKLFHANIIVDHLSDYFELSNQTLKDTNDQFIEACHAKVKKFFDNHPNYKFKEKNSAAYGEALLAAIVHFNSNNLGFV